MKLNLKGRRFVSIEEIQAESQDVMMMIMLTLSSASDHGNPVGIAVLTQKGTTSKEMEANKHFDKWLSLGRRTSG
jgi:hypothetical protein